MGKLDNQIALVTGGSRGIGLAIARAFTAEGATVAITYHPSESSPTAARLGRRDRLVRADGSSQSGKRAAKLAHQ